MITFKQKGNFNGLEKFLKNNSTINYTDVLERYGKQGVIALSAATPIDTGKTADSWGYKIEQSKGGATIYWTNSNIIDGTPVAILLQYGHATQNGGYVKGVDYINPALKPIFENMANEAWREITKV